jgi:D-alanyl-D-alanine carboxypeptidase
MKTGYLKESEVNLVAIRLLGYKRIITIHAEEIEKL